MSSAMINKTNNTLITNLITFYISTSKRINNGYIQGGPKMAQSL